jgi:hypothetical protein
MEGHFCTIEREWAGRRFLFQLMSWNVVLNYMLFKSGLQPELDVACESEYSALCR